MSVDLGQRYLWCVLLGSRELFNQVASQKAACSKARKNCW